MGSTSTAAVAAGSYGTAPARVLGGMGNLTVRASFTMSSSYATGGDTLVLPTKVKGADLKGVVILNPTDGTRLYAWDGSTSTPKIKAYTALNAEVAATTNLSAVTLQALLIYEG